MVSERTEGAYRQAGLAQTGNEVPRLWPASQSTRSAAQLKPQIQSALSTQDYKLLVSKWWAHSLPTELTSDTPWTQRAI